MRAHLAHAAKSPLRDAKDLEASDQHSRDSFMQLLIIVMAVLCSKHKGGEFELGPLSCRACFSSSTQLLLRSVSFCFHALRSVQFSFWLSSFATIVDGCFLRMRMWMVVSSCAPCVLVCVVWARKAGPLCQCASSVSPPAMTCHTVVVLLLPS